MNRIGETNVHTNKRPGTHYVICLIEVWRPNNPFDYSDPTNVLRLTECGSFKCEESYSSILGTMELTIPKGSVVRKTIENETESKHAYDDIYISQEDFGVVNVVKSNVSVANVKDFSPGNRIRVYVGYTEDKDIVDLGRIDKNPSNTIFGGNESIIKKYKDAMGGFPVFDGYIVKCSDKTPITVYGENMASALKKISVPPQNNKSKSITDILKDIKLEKTTGIITHPSIESAISSINLPAVFEEGMTVLDVFSNYMKDYGLYSKIVWLPTLKKYAIRIGYSFSSGVNTDDSDEPCIYDGKDAYVVYSDYNVSSDNLKYENIDPYYMVIKCHATVVGKKGKRTNHSFCMRLNPELVTKGSSSSPFIYFNEMALSKDDRKKIRQRGSVKFDTSSYKVYDRTYPVSIVESKYGGVDKIKTALKRWSAIQFYSAMKNGISGTLSLFGDFHLQSGDFIEYVDARYKNRCGTYLIEKVTTTLSVSGLRQEVSIPYKVVGSKETIEDLLKDD